MNENLFNERMWIFPLNKYTLFILLCTGTRIRTLIEGFGDLNSTIELCPYGILYNNNACVTIMIGLQR